MNQSPYWFQTASEIRFDYKFVRPQMINIADIARALSRIPRFLGHTKHFYSVATHSMFVARQVPEQYALEGLLHDAAEAYIGDMPAPLKRFLQASGNTAYKDLETKIEVAIAEAFELDDGPVARDTVKYADQRALVTEKIQLLGEPPTLWKEDELQIEPYPCKLHCDDPMMAQAAFMKTYLNLRRTRVRKSNHSA